jgi:hypothetical protein
MFASITARRKGWTALRERKLVDRLPRSQESRPGAPSPDASGDDAAGAQPSRSRSAAVRPTKVGT